MTVQLNPWYTFPLSDFPVVEDALEKTIELTEKMLDGMSSLRVAFNPDGDEDGTEGLEVFVSKERHAYLLINYNLDDQIYCGIDLCDKTLKVNNVGTESDHPLIQAIQSKCKQSLEEYMSDWVKEGF